LRLKEQPASTQNLLVLIKKSVIIAFIVTNEQIYNHLAAVQKLLWLKTCASNSNHGILAGNVETAMYKCRKKSAKCFCT